jgi:hypothetical protein
VERPTQAAPDETLVDVEPPVDVEAPVDAQPATAKPATTQTPPARKPATRKTPPAARKPRKTAAAEAEPTAAAELTEALAPEATTVPAHETEATRPMPPPEPESVDTSEYQPTSEYPAPDFAAPEYAAPDGAATDFAYVAGASGGTPPPRRSPAAALADRLDEGGFFEALFDVTFTRYVTRRLAGPLYVVGLAVIALSVIYGIITSLATAVATGSAWGVLLFLFGLLLTVVAGMLAILLLRVAIEAFVAIVSIAENTRPLRRNR